MSGTFPLVSNIGDFVTQEAGGNLLFSGNGYVETVSPTGQVLSTFGAANIQGNGAHSGSGSQFYYPGQAVQAPDGTIYTADPLYSMEATSPNGFLRGSTTLGGGLAFGGWGFALVGSTFYFQSGAPFNGSADAISIVLAGQRPVLPVRDPASLEQPRLGSGPHHPGPGQLLRPGHDPLRQRRRSTPGGRRRRRHLQLSYSVWTPRP